MISWLLPKITYHFLSALYKYQSHLWNLIILRASVVSVSKMKNLIFVCLLICLCLANAAHIHERGHRYPHGPHESRLHPRARKVPREMRDEASSIYDIPWDSKYNSHPNRLSWWSISFEDFQCDLRKVDFVFWYKYIIYLWLNIF